LSALNISSAGYHQVSLLVISVIVIEIVNHEDH